MGFSYAQITMPVELEQPSIVNRVSHARYRFMSLTPREPAHLYVGEAEWREMRKIMLHQTAKESFDSLSRTFFMGMEVHRVMEPDHLMLA